MLAAHVLDRVSLHSDLRQVSYSFNDAMVSLCQCSLLLCCPYTVHFLGLPLVRWYPCTSIFRKLSLLLRVTWPNYVELRFCKRSIHYVQFNTQILLNVDVASSIPFGYVTNSSQNRYFEALSFRLFFFFKVHVSALYRTVAKVWYNCNITLLHLLVSRAFHILSKFLTTSAARSVLRSVSLSHDWSAETVPPNIWNSLVLVSHLPTQSLTVANTLYSSLRFDYHKSKSGTGPEKLWFTLSISCWNLPSHSTRWLIITLNAFSVLAEKAVKCSRFTTSTEWLRFFLYFTIILEFSQSASGRNPRHCHCGWLQPAAHADGCKLSVPDAQSQQQKHDRLQRTKTAHAKCTVDDDNQASFVRSMATSAAFSPSSLKVSCCSLLLNRPLIMF